jgi:hypothetical protein
MAKRRSPLFVTISGADEDRRELVARLLFNVLDKHPIELDHVNVNEGTVEQYDLYPDRQMLKKMYGYPVKITTSPGPKPLRSKRKKGGRPTLKGAAA